MMISRKISENQKLLVLSLLVGLCSGFAAVILIKLIQFFQNLTEGSPWRLYLPAAGMLSSLLILRFIVKDHIGHGVTRVLKAVSTKESYIKPHNMWSSVLTSALTIGFGGSVGAEAPIVYTGAAFGSNIGRWAHLSRRSITILVGCGAAGAVAGIFKAPLAGILFTLEILLFNISMTSMTPLLLSSVSAAVVSYLCLGQSAPFECTLRTFQMANIPYYVLLGVFCGFISLYFQNVTLAMEDSLRKLRNPYLKWALCSAGLILLIFLFPPLFGEGYDFIRGFLNGTGQDMLAESSTPFSLFLRTPWGLPVFFLFVMLFKVVSMTFTNAGGGVGGTFGPTLFIGAIAGFVIVRSLNLAFGVDLPEQNFVLVGMAGAMAGVMKAPMTAIFLIAEISGGYELFIPLIIASTVSFGVSRIWEEYSIYTKRLAQSGELLTHDSDQAVLTLMKTDELIRDKYPKVRRNDSLRSVVGKIAGSTAAVIAVLDSRGRFVGVIDIGMVRQTLFNQEEYDTTFARDIMEQAPECIQYGEKMDSVMRKFDRTEAWRLPVVDSDGKYLGFISRSRLLTEYREKLKDFSHD